VSQGTYNLYIDGTLIDRAATNCELLSATLYSRGGIPSLSFRRKGYVLVSQPDPWDAQPVRLTRVDPDTLVETTIFSGDTCTGRLQYSPASSWVRTWQCLGLRNRADWIPVTDSNTQTDISLWNLPGDDPLVIPSREGRTVGQIVADVLEQPANKAALISYGIGNYTSPSGSGAEATVTISGGAITAVTIDNGGSGYAAAPTIFVAGGGGSGAVLTPTISGGAITAIAITNGGSGYITTPTIVFSTLPAVTIADLDTLFLIPPYRITIAGERLLQAIDSTVSNAHPNHVMHIDPAGNIRFLDQRTFAATTLQMDGTDPRVGQCELSIDWNDCYSQVEIRGTTMTRGVNVGVVPAPGSNRTDNGLAEDFAHDGLTNAQAIALWLPADFSAPNQPSGGATAIANTAGGKVVSLTITNGGYGYSAPPAVLISGGSGSGATATATVTGGAVTNLNVTGQGSGYTSIPKVTIATPGGSGQTDVGTCTCTDTTHIVVTSSNGAVSWAADYWDQTDNGRHGMLILSSDTFTDIDQFFQARVIANTSLSAGGTCTLTLDTPLPNLTYNSYQLFGLGGGASVVWRRYKVTNATYAATLQSQFPYPFAMKNSDGTSATLTSTPTANIYYQGQSAPMGFAVDPDAGTITLYKPAALVFGGGTIATPPDDVQAFLAVAVGVLQAFAPSSSTYSGTAHSTYGIQRRKTITLRDWSDYSNQSNMNLYASEYLDAIKDVFIEGTVPYYGELSWALTFGASLNLTGNGYTTGFETMAVPIVQLDMEFHEDAEGATSFTSTLHISNRRSPYSADLFLRPNIPIGGSMIGQEDFVGNDAFSAMGTGYGATMGALEGIQAAAQSGSLPGDPSTIPTNPGAYLPSQADFESLGIDVTGGYGGGQTPAAAPRQTAAPDPGLNRLLDDPAMLATGDIAGEHMKQILADIGGD